MSVIQASTKPAIVAVSFDAHASAIAKGFKTFDAAYGKLTAIVNREMQAHLDAWIIAGNGRDQASCNALGKSIRDSQVVLDLVATGAMEKKTFTEYAQSAMRALHFNVPFSADLKNDADRKLPWSKAGKDSATAKSGKVTVTTREEADKTLSKAIAQYRAIGCAMFAAELVDLAMDSLAGGFKETVLDK